MPGATGEAAALSKKPWDRQIAVVSALTDPEQQARDAHALANDLEAAAAEARRVRAEAINTLVSNGRSQGEVAKMLGLTRARVGKLLESGPKPERALLGTGPLTVSIGGKWEASKPSGDPVAVTSHEAGKAYELIAKAAREYDLGAERNDVPPPGISLRLNVPNLIVIGSPRILPLMSQVLEADPHLGFGSSARGWYVTEHEKVHRSPNDEDSGAYADYAYIGRLPRTDSKGTFLYLAGIHPPGTLGAAIYLTEHIEEIYEEVKRGRWSRLVKSYYDPDTREIQSVEPLTQIYTPKD